MSAPQQRHPAAFFVNAPFDFAFVGGLSILACIAVKLFGPAAHSETAAQLAAGMQWVINWPHFSATVFRLFRTRENANQYPITAYVIPFLVFGGALGSLFSPAIIAPFYVKLFLIWSPYHFSGQSVGISLIYARRAGVTIRGWPRWAMSAFIFGTYATSTLRAETSVVGNSYYGIEYPGLGVPAWLPVAAEYGMYLGGALFLFFAIRWSLSNKRAFPLMVLLPGLTQFVWFIAGANLQAFYVFVPLFHSLQYLPIAWSMQLAERMGESGEKPSGRFVAVETARWALANFLGGAALFWLLPHTVAGFDVNLAFATGVMISGVQIHHFFVDGVIWKLRNAKVSSPLIANVHEYMVAPAEVSSKTRAAA